MKDMTQGRWALLTLGVFLALCALCAMTVRLVDPFFHYHDPDPAAEVWFDQRAQGAGLLRSQEYETVFMGSSLAANYHAFWFDNLYGTSTVKITYPNGSFTEFGQALSYAYSCRDVKRVIFGLDPNLLMRDTAEDPEQLPLYLYDHDPWNDGQYLLNKDALLRSGYTVLKKLQGETQTLQDAFLWDGTVFFSRELALGSYVRPEAAETAVPADAFLESTRAHLAVVTGWLEEHPDTEFLLFVPPYSILFWDRAARLGETEAVFAALAETMETLLRYDNVELQFFMDDRAVITDLDNYADHIHAAGRVTYRMAVDMPAGVHRLTRETWRERLDALRDFVVHYDYDSIFEEEAAEGTAS